MTEEPAKRWFQATASLAIESGGHRRRKGAGTYRAGCLLARPDDLDRTVHVHRDLDRNGNAVNLEAATKPATQQMLWDHHLLQRQSGGFFAAAA